MMFWSPPTQQDASITLSISPSITDISWSSLKSSSTSSTPSSKKGTTQAYLFSRPSIPQLTSPTWSQLLMIPCGRQCLIPTLHSKEFLIRWPHIIGIPPTTKVPRIWRSQKNYEITLKQESQLISSTTISTKPSLGNSMPLEDGITLKMNFREVKWMDFSKSHKIPARIHATYLSVRNYQGVSSTPEKNKMPKFSSAAIYKSENWWKIQCRTIPSKSAKSETKLTSIKMNLTLWS